METWGRYRIESEIARGAYGIVYRAHDTEADRTVALKTLREDRPSGVILERFLREARLAAGLNHPAIVRIYETGWWDHRVYFTMEYLEGETLADRIARGPMSADEVAELAVVLSRALDYAHRRGVVHRDIKPSNIMLTPRGPVITDFGLAYSPSAVSRLTQSGEVVGTPAYMSPEVIRGGARAADARSDIYALGTVLFEALAGQPPFDGSSFLEFSDAVLHDPPPRPPALADIILCCLRKRPAERFQSAGEIAMAILGPPKRRRLWPALFALPLSLCALLALRRPQEAPKVRITSEPSGARVTSGGQVLGYTPLEIPPGDLRELTLAKAGFADRTVRVRGSVHVRLYTPGELPDGMVLMDGWLIDARPVSNREYARFLRTALRDSPWPRNQPPKGEEDEPVTDVSHDDAAAYARWAGKRLPTMDEWRCLPSSRREWTSTPGRTGFLIAGPDGVIDASSDFRSGVVGFRCAMSLQE